MKFLLIAFAVTCLSLCNEVNSECVIVALPNGTSLNLATKVAKNRLKLFTISSQTEHEILVDFVSGAFQDNLNNDDSFCSEVIGVVGDLDSTTASIIHTLASRSNLNITLVAAVAPSTFLPVTNVALPNVLDMNPLVHYIESLVSFTDQLNWTRIGLISDGSHYHELAAELFQKQLLDDFNITVAPYIRLDNNSEIMALQMVQEFETRIIFLSMDAATACSVLEEAQKLDTLWPEYAWIVFDYTSNFACSFDLEGVIFLKQLSINEEPCDESCSRPEETAEIVRTTLYTDSVSVLDIQTKVLLDSILAVVLADSIEGIDITNTSFVGTTGLVSFRDGLRLSNISVVQSFADTVFEVASYDSDTKQLATNSTFLALGTGPRGCKLVIFDGNTMAEIVVISLASVLCFAFVTVVLVLFVAFRKEKEIKAASFSVSLCMFAGCYLLLAHTPVLLVEAQRASSVAIPADLTCNVLAWLSIIGLPSSVILATLLVKIMRIFAIFHNPFLSNKKFYTDYALLIYIIVIVSPALLLLIIWAAADPLINMDVVIETESELQVLESCTSNNTIVWIAILVLYTIALIVAVVVIAFKTTNVRYKHFQDTKATNAFAFLSILLIIVSTLYFAFFDTFFELSFAVTSSINATLYISHILFALLCQFFLFIPKVLPPLKRKLFRNHIKSKKQSIYTDVDKRATSSSLGSALETSL